MQESPGRHRLAGVRSVLLSPHLVAFLAVVIFGANFVVVRGVYREYGPATLSLWRWGTPALILLPFVWRDLAGEWAFIRTRKRTIIACAVLMPIIGALFGYLAMARTVAVNGAIFQSMIPVFVALLASLTGIDRLGRRQLLGLAVAISGALWLVTRGDPGVLRDLAFNAGDLLLLASALGLAGYTVMVKTLGGRPRPLVFLFVLCTAGSVLHLPFVAEEMVRGVPFLVNARTLGAIAFAAIFPSLLAVMFYNYGVARLGPGRASAYHYLLPVVTAILAWLFLGEALQSFHVVGAILIVAGVYNATRPAPATG